MIQNEGPKGNQDFNWYVFQSWDKTTFKGDNETRYGSFPALTVRSSALTRGKARIPGTSGMPAGVEVKSLMRLET